MFYYPGHPQTFNYGRTGASSGGTPAFNPATYGTVISAHTARGLGFIDGASVPSLPDESGNGNTFTAPAGSNEGTYDDGEPAVVYDGDDYYRAASRTNYNTLHQTPRGTVVARVALANVASGVRHAIFGTGTVTKSNTGVTVIIDDAAGTNRLRAGVFPNANPAVYDLNSAAADLTLTAGVFVIVAAAWDGTDMRLYASGAHLVTDTSSGSPDPGPSTQFPEIGAVGGTTQIEGEISDVIVYSDKLDAAAIADLTTALEAEYV